MLWREESPKESEQPVKAGLFDSHPTRRIPKQFPWMISHQKVLGTISHAYPVTVEVVVVVVGVLGMVTAIAEMHGTPISIVI